MSPWSVPNRVEHARGGLRRERARSERGDALRCVAQASEDVSRGSALLVRALVSFAAVVQVGDCSYELDDSFAHFRCEISKPNSHAGIDVVSLGTKRIDPHHLTFELQRRCFFLSESQPQG